MPLGAHDLVRIDPSIALRWPDAASWVAQSLRRAPWVVVRRERADGVVPIGVRGTRRSGRFAATIAFGDVRESISPYDLGGDTDANGRLSEVFNDLRKFALGLGLRVGPIGSFGFEIASGVHVTHETSDLDVLVEAAGIARSALGAFSRHVAALSTRSGIRIDAELAYDDGGAALAEIIGGNRLVLFKTSSGPRLLPCPV
jgi:phosphoribosyl-dephospho-CoA transferase